MYALPAPRRRRAVIPAALALLLALTGPAAAATVFTVTTTADGNDGACDAHCTLREAVVAANAAPDADTIVVPAGTYTLTGAGNEDLAASGDLDLLGSVTITGAGAGVTIVDGGGNDRLIDIVASATVTIADLTLRNGRVAAGDTQGGGAILWNEPVSGKTLDLRLAGVVVAGNSAGEGDGGGILIEQDKPAFSVVTITDSVISGNTMDDGDGGGLHLCCENLDVTIARTIIDGNTAVDDPNVVGLNGEGGGIYHCCTDTSLTISDSTISDNTGPTQGGGLYTCCGVASNTLATLDRTTVSGNTALGTAAGQGGGGGIEGEGAVTLVNSTLSGNRAFKDGGGIENEDVLVMRNVTIADNEAGRGGGFYEDGIATTLVDTLFAGNLAAGVAANCGVAFGTDPLVSEGGNLSSDGTCPLAGMGDRASVDPLLEPLADNGGPSLTHALAPSSPAIDGGSDAGCQAVDQRGALRPADGDNDGSARCDVGALEIGSIVEDCDNGIDDNANGLVDCLDLDCAGESFCPERCDNCIDDDGDGATDRADVVDCQEPGDGGGAAVANPTERAKPVVQCAVALRKAGGKVTLTRLQTLQTCLASLTTCVQKKASDPRCLAKAGAVCRKNVAKLGTLDTKARASIAKRCDALTSDELLSTSGLGFVAEAQICDALGVPGLDDIGEVTSCLLAQHACAVERLVVLDTPRAGELLTLGGVPAASVFACAAVVTTGAGTGLGPRGKKLDTCERTRQKATAKLVAAATDLAGRCATMVLTCRQQKPSDLGCITKAQKACPKLQTKLTTLATKLGATVAKKCDEPTLAIGELLGATGSGFQSAAPLCKALGVSSLTNSGAITDCLTRYQRCRAAQLLERELPRQHELLGTGGFVLP